MFDSSQITWPRPWRPITPKEAKEFEKELKREVCDEHALFDRKAKAVGRRIDCDDVLFHLEDAGTQLAVTHLTWKEESNYNWPFTEFFISTEDWIETRMKPDVEDYESRDYADD
jgi:hypothetical protein